MLPKYKLLEKPLWRESSTVLDLYHQLIRGHIIYHQLQLKQTARYPTHLLSMLVGHQGDHKYRQSFLQDPKKYFFFQNEMLRYEFFLEKLMK